MTQSIIDGLTEAQPIDGTCRRCRWFNPAQSECRRHAPIFNDACGSIFPQNLSGDDWCGDFDPLVRLSVAQELRREDKL